MDDTQIRIDPERYNELYNDYCRVRAENQSLRTTIRNLYEELMRIVNETNDHLKT